MTLRWPYRVMVVVVLSASLLLIARPATGTANNVASPTACVDDAPFPNQDLWIVTRVKNPSSAEGGVSSVRGNPASAEGNATGTEEGSAGDEGNTTNAEGSPGATEKNEAGAGTAGGTLDRINVTFVGGAEAHTLAVRFDRAGRAVLRTPAGWRLTKVPTGVSVAACPAQAGILGIVPEATGPATAAAAPARPVLPNTGQDVGAMFTLGVTLVVAGVLLLIVRRRPRETAPVRPEPAALVWVQTKDRVQTQRES